MARSATWRPQCARRRGPQPGRSEEAALVRRASCSRPWKRRSESRGARSSSRVEPSPERCIVHELGGAAAPDRAVSKAVLNTPPVSRVGARAGARTGTRPCRARRMSSDEAASGSGCRARPCSSRRRPGAPRGVPRRRSRAGSPPRPPSTSRAAGRRGNRARRRASARRSPSPTTPAPRRNVSVIAAARMPRPQTNGMKKMRSTSAWGTPPARGPSPKTRASVRQQDRPFAAG